MLPLCEISLIYGYRYCCRHCLREISGKADFGTRGTSPRTLTTKPESFNFYRINTVIMIIYNQLINSVTSCRLTHLRTVSSL